ncbi:MAG: rhomboid family intramembrane serine protease [Pyrobaculum sp.]
MRRLRAEDEEEEGWTNPLAAGFKELKDTSPHHTPYATYGLIVVNAVLFFPLLGMLFKNPWSAGLTPSEFLDNPLNPRVLISMFAHGGILHILGNMAFLYKYGDNVEAAMGRARYLLFYLAAGYVAAASQALFASAVGGAKSMLTPMVGASGAISGVVGAYLYLWPGARTYRCFCLRYACYCKLLKARHDVAIWAGFQFVTPLIEPSVAVFAHMGGFAAGVALAPFLVDRRRVEELRRQIAGGLYKGPPPEEGEAERPSWDAVAWATVALIATAVIAAALAGAKSHYGKIYHAQLGPKGVTYDESTGPPTPFTVREYTNTECYYWPYVCTEIRYVEVVHGPSNNLAVGLTSLLVFATAAASVYSSLVQSRYEIL